MQDKVTFLICNPGDPSTGIDPGFAEITIESDRLWDEDAKEAEICFVEEELLKCFETVFGLGGTTIQVQPQVTPNCPKCGWSDMHDIEREMVCPEGLEVYQRCECMACGESWSDVYTLTRKLY